MSHGHVREFLTHKVDQKDVGLMPATVVTSSMEAKMPEARLLCVFSARLRTPGGQNFRSPPLKHASQ